jgi:hypothetical protein
MRRVEDLLRATAKARHFWFRGFRAFITPLVIDTTSGRTDVRILDCGCGTVANLALLGRFGRAYGFDLPEAGLRIGREAGRTRLTQRHRRADRRIRSRDIVRRPVLAPDAGRARSCQRDVSADPAGRLRAGQCGRPGDARGDHSVLSRDVRRSSRSTLRALRGSAGFTVERITYTNTALFLSMALVRTVQRLRGLSNELEAPSEISVPPVPINAVLTGVLLLESLWVRRFDSPFGSSLLCLAKKPA